jgi:hypothetical protein
LAFLPVLQDDVRLVTVPLEFRLLHVRHGAACHVIYGGQGSLKRGKALIVSGFAELPQEIRRSLVSWNHSTDYEVPTYKDYADHMGGSQWEKTYDLGA